MKTRQALRDGVPIAVEMVGVGWVAWAAWSIYVPAGAIIIGLWFVVAAWRLET